MKAYCYILKSKKLNRFYIGATKQNLEERLSQHLQKAFGVSCFTSNADDWQLYYFIECKDFSQATLIERHIKNMKSKKYIENLLIYPEIALKFLQRYS